MISVLKKIYHSIFSENFRLKFKKKQFRLKGVFLKGNKVECNCCKNTYRSFLDKKDRKNTVCPNCGSLERTRMLLFYLEKETKIFEDGQKVLHFAPEDGLKMIFKNQKQPKDYVNGDINPNYADQVMDIMEIPFSDNEFDYIICSHVLGHVSDEHKALTEMYRVLKPKGKAIVLTLLNKKNLPTFENPEIVDPKERLKNYGEPDLLRLHGNDVGSRIEKAGFTVQKIDYTSTLDKEIVKRFRLYNPERGQIFVCEK